MKKQKTVSIKAKLLGVIIPVVIAIVVVLVVAAYQISAGTIKKYSQNLLQSSVENQASQIEAWLNENLASFQMAKTIIEDLKPSGREYNAFVNKFIDILYSRFINALCSVKKQCPIKVTCYEFNHMFSP